MRFLIKLKRFFYHKKNKTNFSLNPKLQKEALMRSIEIRQSKAILKKEQLASQILYEKKKQVKIADEMSEYQPEQEESDVFNPDKILIDILSKAMTNRAAPQQTNLINHEQPIQQQPKQELNLSREQIKEELKKIPSNYLNIARNLPDEVLKSYARKHFDFNEATINEAVNIIKNKEGGVSYVG